MGLSRTEVGRALVAGLALVGMVATSTARAEDPEGEAWVGLKVIQKAEGFAVKDDDGSPITGANLRIETYRVERVDGNRLRLRAPGLEGWARADQVVPVDKAEGHFTEYIKEHPRDAFGYTMRATIRHKVKNDLVAAMADYDEAVRVAPGASHVYNNRANASMARRDYDRAIADYGEALRLAPGNAIAWTNRGSAWAAKRQFALAIADHERAIAASTNYATAYLNRASAFRGLKQYDRALADYDRALAIDPKFTTALIARAATHLATEAFDKAFADLDEAVRLEPQSSAPYNARGHAHSARKEYDRALADFDRAIAIDPRSSSAYSNRGLVRRTLGQTDAALADFDAAARLDPASVFAQNNRGITFEERGDYDRALAAFDQAIRLDPKDSLPRRNRAVVGLLTGRASATDDARAAIDCDGWWSESSLYAVLVGHFAARRSGRPEEARSLLDEAFRRCDDSAWPYPVVRLLRGELDEAGLMALAVDSDKRTEARCYLGLDRLLSGQPGPAREHFAWVKEHGNRTFMEYSVAVAELRRLDTPPRTP